MKNKPMDDSANNIAFNELLLGQTIITHDGSQYSFVRVSKGVDQIIVTSLTNGLTQIPFKSVKSVSDRPGWK